MEGACLKPFDMADMHTCFTYDEFGNRYEVPMYALHLPSNLLDDGQAGSSAAVVEVSEEEKKLAEAESTIKVRLSTAQDLTVTLRGKEHISDLKLRVREQMEFPTSTRLRIIYRGKSLADELTIMSCNIEEGTIVQVMVRKAQ